MVEIPFFTDTDRREAYLKEKGIHFFGIQEFPVGLKVSKGPSICLEEIKKPTACEGRSLKAVSCKIPRWTLCGLPWLQKISWKLCQDVSQWIENSMSKLTSRFMNLMRIPWAYRKKLLELHDSLFHLNSGSFQFFLVRSQPEILCQKIHSQMEIWELILDKAKQKGTGENGPLKIDGILGIPVPHDRYGREYARSPLERRATLADEVYSDQTSGNF